MTTSRSGRRSSSILPRAGAAFRQKNGAPADAAGKRLPGDLLLADHRVGLADDDVCCRQARVGSRRHDDHVLAAALDEDQGDAALPVVADHAADVDALALQRTQHEVVAADAPNEPHVRAESRRRNSLVCPLATRDALELRIRDRLARARQPLAAGDEVDVRGANDRDPRGGRHAADAKAT